MSAAHLSGRALDGRNSLPPGDTVIARGVGGVEEEGEEGGCWEEEGRGRRRRRGEGVEEDPQGTRCVVNGRNFN